MLAYILPNVLFLSLSTCGIYGHKLPSQFKKCSIKDTSCLKDAIQDALPKLKGGIPSLGVPSIDPIDIPEMKIAAGPSVVKLEQKYKDAQFSGLSTSHIDDLIFDKDGGKIIIGFSLDKISLNATYEVNGNILVFPVYGSGASTTNLDGVSATIEFDIETFMKKNETYMRGKRAAILHPKATHAYFHLDNLFGGNKELGDNINTIINENWQAVFDELISGYVSVLAESLLNIMNRFFSKVPISEMFVI